MKRRNFNITLDGQPVATCHSWNSRHKYITAHLKTLDAAAGGYWHLTNLTGNKNADGRYADGSVTWTHHDGQMKTYLVREANK